jgi:hypothetical protein
MSKKEIIMIVSIFLSIYLGIAFIAMEFNPAKWYLIGRVLYVMITLLRIMNKAIDKLLLIN